MRTLLQVPRCKPLALVAVRGGVRICGDRQQRLRKVAQSV